MNRLIFALICIFICVSGADADTTDDMVFIHHSCGQNWLTNSLHSALLSKDYIDERNDIYYGTDMSPDAGRPDSLAPTPGDKTDMNHWIRWFNDYLGHVKTHGCASGMNVIIMFKSCYPNSNITADGTGGDPFSSTKTIANYKAVYRHPDGPGHTYSYGGYTYKPLEDIFAENPDVLFIPVTAPPRHYAPSDATNDAEAHRARVFNNWLKNDWLSSYNAANPGLNNVAVFDWFDVLAYADDHALHPNRLKSDYGGTSGNSHPNSTANSDSTAVFATDTPNFIDQAWEAFAGEPTYTLTVTNGTGSGEYDPAEVVGISADPPASGKLFIRWIGDTGYVADAYASVTTVTMPAADVSVTATYGWGYTLTVNSGSGSGFYLYAAVVDIQADPAPTNMVFDEWVGDTSGVADPESPATTYTIPTHACEITATYRSSLPGDLDGNGFVGQGDLDIVLADWGNGPPVDPRADPSGDGFVGQADLDIVLDHWGSGTMP